MSVTSQFSALESRLDGVLYQPGSQGYDRATSPLNSIARRVVRVGAGVSWQAVHVVSGQHGLLGLSGSGSDVGVAGYTFYGGVGWLTRPYGFASASLRAVEFIDGNGEWRRADAEHEQEALWAFRGGGGVGIATALEFDLFALDHLTAGYILWPAEYAQEMFSAWGEAVTGWGPSLTTFASVLHLPDTQDAPGGLGGQPVAYLRAATVDPAQVRDVEELLDELPQPAVSTFGPCDAQRLGGIHLDAHGAAPVVSEGRWLTADAGAHAADILTVYGTDPDSPLQEVEIRHLAVGGDVPGALTVPPGDFLLQAAGATMDDEGLAAVKDGQRAVLDAAARDRLLEIETTYDPEETFTIPRPLARPSRMAQ